MRSAFATAIAFAAFASLTLPSVFAQSGGGSSGGNFGAFRDFPDVHNVCGAPCASFRLGKRLPNILPQFLYFAIQCLLKVLLLVSPPKPLEN